jgi:hypothetical protein
MHKSLRQTTEVRRVRTFLIDAAIMQWLIRGKDALFDTGG